MIPVTDHVGPSCDTRSQREGMKNKTLATVLFACVLCWSLLPMTMAALTMHTMRASTTGAAQEHSCCPEVHPRARPSGFATSPPATMPCDSRHPCCMQQAPENSPALPALRIDSRPDLYLLHVGGSYSEITLSQPVTAAPFALNLSEPYLRRTTVLRI